MKKISLIIITAVFSGILYSQDFNPEFSIDKANSINIPLPQLNSKPKTHETKKWTIMVFLNAKNDLELAGLYNLNQMEMVGSNNDVNIIVEMGRMNGQPRDTDIDGNWTGVRRYYVKKDNDTEKVNSPVIFKQDKYDMGDYKQVVNFVKWTKANYPAQRYMLILWDHGTGWLDPRPKQKSVEKGISFDDETGNYIRTKQIGDILKESGKVNILAFDACLMQMAEILSEVKDYTNVIVGSEEVIPGTGYPYSLFLSAIEKKPSMSDEDVGAVIVESFKLFYEKVKRPAMLSAIRSSKIAELNKIISDFAALNLEVKDNEAIKKAKTEILRFDILGNDDENKEISFFGDLYQFADILAKNIKKTDIKATILKSKAEELKNFISKQLIIYKGAYGADRTGKKYENAGGISVYIPPINEKISQEKLENIFESSYKNFQFNNETKWHDFATFMYSVK